jgi:hypothetical protein
LGALNSASVVVTLKTRGGERLDRDLPVDRADPELAEVVAFAHGLGALVLGGGEPTLRADLPALIRALARPVTLHTDGHVLAVGRIAEELRGLGVVGVRIPFHSARADAHDWLVGRPGAARRALQGLRAAKAAGLAVEAELVVTRPTAPYLAETVEALARVGVGGVVLRRVVGRGPAANDFVALSPRFGLLEPWLEQAIATAARLGLGVSVRGFPACAVRQAAARDPDETWLLPPSIADLAPRFAAVYGPGCARCPGPPGCAGAPLDYVRVFGRDELESLAVPKVSHEPVEPLPLLPSPTRVAGTVKGLGTVEPPPVRGRRPPATRVAWAAVQAHRGDLGGDPLAGLRQGHVPDEVAITWTPATTSRAIRIDLVRAAQVGAPRLLVHGDALDHPVAAELLRECTRLSFPEVVVRVPAHRLETWSDAELRRLRGLSRFEAVMRGSTPQEHDGTAGEGTWDATMRGLRRLYVLTKIAIDLVRAPP